MTEPRIRMVVEDRTLRFQCLRCEAGHLIGFYTNTFTIGLASLFDAAQLAPTFQWFSSHAHGEAESPLDDWLRALDQLNDSFKHRAASVYGDITRQALLKAAGLDPYEMPPIKRKP